MPKLDVLDCAESRGEVTSADLAAVFGWTLALALPWHIPTATYQPRDTGHSVLHAVIRDHLEPFLRVASDRGDGHGLPCFVEQEFREFLTCGVLSHAKPASAWPWLA